MLPFRGLFTKVLGFALYNYLAFLTQKLLPFLQVYSIKEITGFENIPTDNPVIIIGNHNGKLDGPFILGLIKKTAALMKIKYASLPMYSVLVKHLNFVSLDTSTADRLKKSVDEARDVLNRGYNLMIYPEGTRSKSGRLLHFKDFAFRVSKETGYAVVPVVMYSKFGFMTKKASSFFPKQKNIFALRALNPIYLSRKDRAADIAAKTRKLMMDELDKIEKEVTDGI